MTTVPNLKLHGWVDPGMEAPGNSSWQSLKVSRRGEARIIDFISEMLQDGHGYQVRAGTIATPINAQNVIAESIADFCYDNVAGYTHLPIRLGVAVRGVATGTTLQVHLNGIAAVSTVGTAFVPLPLLAGGDASVGTARVQGDTVAVGADAVTTTAHIFEYENVNTATPVNAVGNWDRVTVAAAASQLQYVAKGPACTYFQIASTTAVATYFASYDVLELPSTALGV